MPDDKKLTDLTPTTTPALTDLLYMVADPATTPLDRAIALSTLKALIAPTGNIRTENAIDSKVSDMTPNPAPALTDKLYLCADPDTTPTDRSILLGALQPLIVTEQCQNLSLSIKTLDTDITLSPGNPRVNIFDCGSASRICTLATAGAATGTWFHIRNGSSATRTLTIKQDQTTLVTLPKNAQSLLAWNGVTWNAYLVA